MTPSWKALGSLVVGAILGGIVGAVAPVTHSHGWCYSFTGDHYRCFSVYLGPGDWAVHRLCDQRLRENEAQLDAARWRFVDASVASSLLGLAP